MGRHGGMHGGRGQGARAVSDVKLQLHRSLFDLSSMHVFGNKANSGFCELLIASRPVLAILASLAGYDLLALI